MVSKHYRMSRLKRDSIIKKHTNGDGHIIEGIVIDNKHKHGLEVHSITDNGIIIIHNYNTGKLVTKLIARPNQVKFLYNYIGKEAPVWLLDLAKWHKDMGYNK